MGSEKEEFFEGLKIGAEKNTSLANTKKRQKEGQRQVSSLRPTNCTRLQPTLVPPWLKRNWESAMHVSLRVP